MTKWIIYRQCVCCGKRFRVEISPKSGVYRGGHYFGRHTIPHKGEMIEAEYWECDDCYKE